ncbi:MAG: aspartate carbamoyltransferase regulatory subunit, partial [Clostridiales bacterium]|nr:aspartate carbamoyltransferase regulatory subunit [Clostridiales bacterium]
EKITRKDNLKLPKSLTNVIRCKNPRCITSVEQGITHIFDLADPDSRVYRCRYCEQEDK